MTNRMVRINELVQRELGDILRQDYQNESAAITINSVRVAPDLRDGLVFVSILGDEAETRQRLAWLHRVAPAVRQELGRRITLKFLPRFEYRLDLTAERNLRVQEILDAIKLPEPGEPDAAAS